MFVLANIMSHLLLYYQRPEPATWVFLSSFLLLGIYFVFHRFFCLRNLDILLLLLLAPGFMMVYEGRRLRWQASATPQDSAALANDSRQLANRGAEAVKLVSAVQDVEGEASNAAEQPLEEPPSVSGYPEPKRRWGSEELEFYGFGALLLACFFLMIRMLIDPALVRRPLLIPNLTIGGLIFIGLALFLFMMANIVTSVPRESGELGQKQGPGYLLLNVLPDLPTVPEGTEAREDPGLAKSWLPNMARIIAILSNLFVVLGMVGVGYWHFDNVKTGIGCAVLYLLMPYTAQMTGDLEHTVPGALLTLALLAYRQPLIAGLLLGTAAGLVYYPLFLLPLWISFYWHRGLGRFLTGSVTSLTLLAGMLLFNGEDFGAQISRMFGLWLPLTEGLEGIWGASRVPAAFRLPVLVACIILSGSFVLWPPRKNLGSLMCGTAAVMLAIQFWHGFGGGLFMAWFLPFALLTMFRPNLDDRVATKLVRALKKERPTPAAEG